MLVVESYAYKHTIVCIKLCSHMYSNRKQVVNTSRNIQLLKKKNYYITLYFNLMILSRPIYTIIIFVQLKMEKPLWMYKLSRLDTSTAKMLLYLRTHTKSILI
jgi:hypothetical protein